MVPAEAGYRSLSLPCALGVSPDWLAGWECFYCEDVPMKDSLELSGRVVLADSFIEHPEVSEFRIRLFGYLGENPEVMYCFLDTANNRWVRLKNGQKDENSQIALVDTLSGTILTDLSDGKSYFVDRESHQLFPVGNLEEIHAD